MVPIDHDGFVVVGGGGRMTFINIYSEIDALAPTSPYIFEQPTPVDLLIQNNNNIL